MDAPSSIISIMGALHVNVQRLVFVCGCGHRCFRADEGAKRLVCHDDGVTLFPLRSTSSARIHPVQPVHVQ